LASAVATVLGVCVAIELVGGFDVFRQQAQYYAFLTPQKEEALDWLREHSDARDVVAVSTDRSLPFGWWVEGVSRRSVVAAGDERLMYFQVERDGARRANVLFSRTQFLDAGAVASARASIDFLFVLRSAPGFSLDAVDPTVCKVRFSNASVVIIQLVDSDGG
jgi:hypothetical protein